MRKFYAVVLIFFLLAGCAPVSNQETSENLQDSAFQIEDTSISASGTVIPEKWVNVAFSTGGKDLDILVTIGQEVRQNQLIAMVNQRTADVGMRSAQSQVDSAVAALEQAEESEFATSQDVKAAKAAVEIAEASLEQATLNWINTHLFSPIAGTVIEIYVNPGEIVSPGVPVVLVADLTTLQVKTTDLNEIDAARVSPGDRVEVFFDALPDTVVSGEVVDIALKNAQVAGVYYTVTISLNEIPENLRWGMSAFVKIEVDN